MRRIPHGDRAFMLSVLKFHVRPGKKHEKFKQSKFDIFFLFKHVSGFYKGNCGRNEEIYRDLKIVTKT